MVEVVERLSSKHETLSSIPSTVKKKVKQGRFEPYKYKKKVTEDTGRNWNYAPQAKETWSYLKLKEAREDAPLRLQRVLLYQCLNVRPLASETVRTLISVVGKPCFKV
jgi:hypothetical protein